MSSRVDATGHIKDLINHQDQTECYYGMYVFALKMALDAKGRKTLARSLYSKALLIISISPLIIYEEIYVLFSLNYLRKIEKMNL